MINVTDYRIHANLSFGKDDATSDVHYAFTRYSADQQVPVANVVANGPQRMVYCAFTMSAKAHRCSLETGSVGLEMPQGQEKWSWS